MEEFGLENHFDGFKKIDEDLKKDSKIWPRNPEAATQSIKLN